jgi:hypothetical protein
VIADPVLVLQPVEDETSGASRSEELQRKSFAQRAGGSLSPFNAWAARPKW